MRRKAIVWTDFYQKLKGSFCEHITIDSEKISRYYVNKNFLCEKCFKKYKKISNPRVLIKRELGLLKLNRI